jgi:hypothetical protein
LALPVVFNLFSVSYELDIEEHVLPKIAAPGEAFNTVWYVEQIVHASLSMNVSMSAGSTDSAMSFSEVRILVRRTCWMRFADGICLGILNCSWLKLYAT